MLMPTWVEDTSLAKESSAAADGWSKGQSPASACWKAAAMSADQYSLVGSFLQPFKCVCERLHERGKEAVEGKKTLESFQVLNSDWPGKGENYMHVLRQKQNVIGGDVVSHKLNLWKSPIHIGSIKVESICLQRGEDMLKVATMLLSAFATSRCLRSRRQNLAVTGRPFVLMAWPKAAAGPVR
jgi:hypothetical protein